MPDHIYTDRDGTRYRWGRYVPGHGFGYGDPRKLRTDCLYEFNGEVLTAAGLAAIAASIDPLTGKGIAVPSHAWMPLPRIPDWPIPGPAPQFIAARPMVSHLRRGDWVCTTTGADTRIFQWYNKFEAGRQRDHPWGGYVICRADPAEDFT
jgi:hypothetical protein